MSIIIYTIINISYVTFIGEISGYLINIQNIRKGLSVVKLVVFNIGGLENIF